jgi:hypothetical protein
MDAAPWALCAHYWDHLAIEVRAPSLPASSNKTDIRVRELREEYYPDEDHFFRLRGAATPK